MAGNRFASSVILTLGLLILQPCALADQIADIRSRGLIRVAIINGLPNFSYTAGKQFLGSDVDTAQSLANDLGVKVEFVKVANADRIEALLSNKADLIISALSITPEREQIISFSVPYSQIALVIASPARYNLNSYFELKGKRIGVGRNTSNGEQLRKHAPTAQLVEYEDEHSLIEGYLKADYDIISAQRADIDEINRRAPERKIEEKFIQREFDIAIGIRKNEKGLRDWVNGWVSSNLSNGKLNEIFRKHHGRDLPESVMPRRVVSKQVTK